MKPEELVKRLDAIPQLRLGCYPTPLDAWDRLGDHLKFAGRIYAKREDLTGVAFGGNKIRQLDFILADALQKGADTLVHGGAVQSNYSRMLAAACAKLGLECHLVLSTFYGQPDDTGNALLDKLCGAKIEFVDIELGPEYEEHKRSLAAKLKKLGRRPYVITYPQSEILGTLGYVRTAVELFDQCTKLSRLPRTIVLAAVGSTQSGLLLGCHLLGWDVKILGFSPVRNEFSVVDTLKNSVDEACKLLGIPPVSIQDRIFSSTEYLGSGYAAMNESTRMAIQKVANLEGVFLDPVYTGKAASGLLDLIEKDEIARDGDVIFIHTGGNIALFAYANQLMVGEISTSQN